EFLASYPSLAFRQRLAAAVKRIREGDEAEAGRVLSAAKATTAEEDLELGYCLAFCKTMAGYRHRRNGRKGEARQALHEAMAVVERHLTAARAAGHSRLLELYASLDDELEKDGTP